MRPERQRHHQAKCRKSEEVRTAERLGSIGPLAARRRRAGLTNKGLRPRRNNARRRLVRPEYCLEVLAVFATQYLEVNEFFIFNYAAIELNFNN